MIFTRFRWPVKYQADINLLEGIDAKPPHCEVLVLFNTMLRDRVREHCGAGQSKTGHDGGHRESGFSGGGQDEEGQGREGQGGEGYSGEEHSREGYGRERHGGAGHGCDVLGGEDQSERGQGHRSEGDLDGAGQNSTLDNSQQGLDESGDQGNSTQLSEVDRVDRGRAAAEREKKKKRKRSMKEEGIEDKKDSH